MMPEMHVLFTGGKKVDVQFDDFTVHTDQSKDEGGDNTAPSPFALFLASLASCVGVYARNFCEARKISTQDLAIKMKSDWNEKTKRIDNVEFEFTLPKDFPEKYHAALLRATNLCAVKKHIVNPPEFSSTIVE